VESSRFAWRLGEFSLSGWSRAGDASWFRVQPPGLAFDAGRGAPELVGAGDVFLTHGHLDHALGVPWLVSQRTRHRFASTRVFCPRAIAPEIEGLLAAAARLERVQYQVEVRGLAAGDTVAVGRGLTVEAFSTDHVVPSLGYHLIRQRSHLLPELRGHAEAEIAALRQRGGTVTRSESELWFTYCGDTGAAVFKLEPRVFSTRILLLECTFFGDAHRDHGTRFKHLHLEDIAARASDFHNEALLLSHVSRRYRAAEVHAEVVRRLPELASRVHVLVPEESS
jgi:ribonuclease Z